MARKSIEDVMNEIEDFMNTCKTTALSSNKVIVPRDEFDELFGDLKVKIPAEIDRCKKIMRNKEAILMDARKTADDIIAQATAQANQMISETAIMQQANQQAYETVELARVQANDILGQATGEANEIRLGSMQYTNDIMMGLRNYVEATLNAERANYENLIATLEQDYTIVSANIEEIQGQIVDFTGDPNSVAKAPQIKTAANGKEVPPAPKAKQSMVSKVKNAVSGKDEKNEKQDKSPVDIPDLIATGADYVPNETPLEATVSAKTGKPVVSGTVSKTDSVTNADETLAGSVKEKMPKEEKADDTKASASGNDEEAEENQKPKKVKKVVRKRNPVLHTPQTAQETVAKTLEAAAANKTEKAVYKANGEPARVSSNDAFVVTDYTDDEGENVPVGRSMGVIDDFTMDKKI